ncbi:MAG: hypothetical protein KJZ86_11085 [Caldilineaceae bacterium]|nr:hypothetical protein [Caldilineaceae bacterium]HRJ41767.1 hypothetical protein [Caldilineaceae bacterium]
MGKRKDRREKTQRYAAIARSAARSVLADAEIDGGHGGSPLTDDLLASSAHLAGLVTHSTGHELTKMKKFRFQLLHRWIAARREPCRVADVGGGKGLLAYLLRESGWQATVIDPFAQRLPAKYKDLESNRQIRIAESERVPRLSREFQPEMAADFDLLVAMHAHGCNIQLIDAAAELGREVILLPCCVIHEPILPPPGVHWIQWLVEYVVEKGFVVEPFRLNFKGQNIGLYARMGAGE